MSPEKAVLDIQGQFRVYTEFYRADAAEKTIIMVNGSLATTASFAQTVRNLYPTMNVVLYDQPYAGKSKPHNRHEKPLTREMEGQILLELIDHFNAEHVMSFSWGGAAALVALSHRPKRIESAVISSFSPVLNEHMRDYLNRGIIHLGAHNRYEVGHLINNTIGKHLPSLFKRFNYRHISSLDLHEYDQMHYHQPGAGDRSRQLPDCSEKHQRTRLVHERCLGRIHRRERRRAFREIRKGLQLQRHRRRRALSGHGTQGRLPRFKAGAAEFPATGTCGVRVVPSRVSVGPEPPCPRLLRAALERARESSASARTAALGGRLPG